jgi:DNA-binding IclR family transcriptional regulator
MAARLTFDELKGKTVADLRQMAAGMKHEAVQGYTQMNKEHLLKALCQALGIEMHHHVAIVGLNKSEIKVQLRALKHERDAALAAGDAEGLHAIRRRMHHLKRQVHKATVLD